MTTIFPTLDEKVIDAAKKGLYMFTIEIPCKPNMFLFENKFPGCSIQLNSISTPACRTTSSTIFYYIEINWEPPATTVVETSISNEQTFDGPIDIFGIVDFQN